MLLRIVDRLRAARESDEGFSVIEVMVAMTIFAMIAAGVAAGIVSTMYLTQDNRSREAALQLANQALDAARSTKDVFTLDDETLPATVGKQTYTVKQTTNWINSDGSDNTCGAGSGVLAYKRVAITVSWTSGTSPRQKNVVLDTLISPSSAVSSATASTIVVGVKTATGAANPGVSVTITPDSDGAKSLAKPPAVTDANGCSYAVGVTPGTYKVTIAKAGNIDPTGDSTPDAVVKTIAGGVGNKTFAFDRAISVTTGGPLNLKDGVSAKLPASLPMTYVSGDTVRTATTTPTLLYPFQWTAIAGAFSSTCPNVDPTKWPAAGGFTASPNIFNGTDGTTPGFNPTTDLTVTARAPMGVIDVKTNGLDTVLSATVKNTTAVPNGDPGCGTTTYWFTGLNSNKATTIALPFGTYTLAGTTVLGGLLSNGAVNVSANPDVMNLKVSTSGKVVTLDPRTVVSP
ncbi:prepilin-type N-terminal cleavage/methylation domain-containing protein [Curtobacterium caseinilyticum]|uniref:Prepilin-type N-terminal cleavage/methylation domain-containing protein n=1 Tax=Curtobacterium caseinilyticum TaxID=3055137 RepID=A0ABT7TQ35_9MICO|nr:prepilin-type N-terminal cleavage/methylation domain-containing protein [Curtobacterium caseinilyticum]MDM7891716.1 prepilin-type N-terminal cleavage/methylation domain-containing protein [Curtobacterium caseinilyticum]